MTRTRQQLELSRDQLRTVLTYVKKEVDKLDAEIASMSKPTRLSEAFFWDVIAPTLLDRPDGLEVGDLRRLMEAQGHILTAGTFRTFISRYGARGLLAASGPAKSPKWQISEQAAIEAKEMRKRRIEKRNPPL